MLLNSRKKGDVSNPRKATRNKKVMMDQREDDAKDQNDHIIVIVLNQIVRRDAIIATGMSTIPGVPNIRNVRNGKKKKGPQSRERHL
jgi:hypothetical protein